MSSMLSSLSGYTFCYSSSAIRFHRLCHHPRTLRLCVWSSTWGPGHLASQSLDQTTYLRSSLIVDSLVIRKISSCFFYLFESRRRLQMNYLKQWYGWLSSRSYFKYKIYIYAILTSNIFSYNIFKFWNFSFFLLWYIKSID